MTKIPSLMKLSLRNFSPVSPKISGERICSTRSKSNSYNIKMNKPAMIKGIVILL